LPQIRHEILNLEDQWMSVQHLQGPQN